MPDDIASAAGKLPIKMLHDRILVALRKEDGDRRSTGGILIPATAQVAKRLVWGEARGVGANVARSRSATRCSSPPRTSTRSRCTART